MTTTNKRRQRNRSNASTGAHVAATQPAPKLPFELQPMPVWHWRTLPVFLMFSVGAMIGLQIGLIAGDRQNTGLFLGATTVVALMLGLGFSRLATRFLLSRNWVKPRPKR